MFPNLLLQKSLINKSITWPLALNETVPEVHAGSSPESESSICQRGSLEPFLSGFLNSTTKELKLLIVTYPTRFAKGSFVFLAQLKEALVYAMNRKT